jgi:hypothetical protein
VAGVLVVPAVAGVRAVIAVAGVVVGGELGVVLGVVDVRLALDGFRPGVFGARGRAVVVVMVVVVVHGSSSRVMVV